MIAATIGSIAQWLTLAALAFGGYYVVKGGGGPALSVLETANRVLADRMHDLEASLSERDAKIAELQARTDLEPLVASVAGEFANHERRAQERHEATMELTRELVKATSAHTAALSKAVQNGP